VLELGWRPLTIQAFIFESPFEWYLLGNVAFAIVTRLVAERSLDDHFAAWTEQRLQNTLLSKGDLAEDPDVTSVHGDSLTDRFQPQHLGRRILERVQSCGRTSFFQSPINRNVSLYSGSVNVYAGLQLDIEA
jgi:hypothetical protein